VRTNLIAGAGIASVATSSAWAHGVDPAYVSLIQNGTNLDYMWLGAVHMFTGYDHILFLIGVVFLLTSIADIVKFITAFTVGHSLTLLFGTLAGITANPYLVDAVIAVSVIYKAFDNLDGFRRYLQTNAPNALAMVFAFGLVHGFGLATRIQEFPLPEDALVWRIMSFNLGVELGQVGALIVILAAVNLWRRFPSFSRLTFAANSVLALAGAGLLAMQLHGYAHTADPHLAIAATPAEAVAEPQKVAEAATDYVLGLVAGGEIGEAWLTAEPSPPEPRRIGGQAAWLVQFQSPANPAGGLTLFMNGNGSTLLSFREKRP
jgi:hypothetical protein